MSAQIKSEVKRMFIIIGLFPKHKFSTIRPMMKRYMRQSKINFFQSPHPQHFDLLCHQHFIYTTLDLADCHEHHLFQSPLRSPSTPNDQLYHFQYQQGSTQPEIQQQLGSFLQKDESDFSDEELTPEINQKINFSQGGDELLLNFTPQKEAIIPEENQTILDKNSTVKKNLHISMTPALSDPRLYQRGLKKLASQAFLFVCSQKKTTYKEVAKRMISQINQDCEFEREKKGQMNIKRRVYDALNVLIALGQLKRNGNRIVAKKAEDKTESSLGQLQKEDSCEEEERSEEKQFLQRMIKEKEDAITEKRQLLEGLKRKMSALKQLENRNKILAAQKVSKIELPFISMTSSEKVAEGDLTMWIQDSNSSSNSNTFFLKFPKQSLKIQGDVDVIQNLEKTLCNERCEKGKRNRRK